MCRMAGYSGPGLPLSALLYDSDRALSTQAWAPHEMLFGNVNVDGTGVAWWPPGASEQPPLRYATAAAPWNDANLPCLAPRLIASTMIAAVRSATPGIPFGPANVAPFVRGPLALSHNGFIQGFRTGVGRALLARLSDAAFAEFDAVSDSQVLLLLVRHHLAITGNLLEATREALADVQRAVHDASAGATLNLLIADGEQLLAVRSSIGLAYNSLYVRSEGASTLVASEPLDTAVDFEPVPPQRVLVIRGGTVDEHQLD